MRPVGHLASGRGARSGPRAAHRSCTCPPTSSSSGPAAAVEGLRRAPGCPTTPAEADAELARHQPGDAGQRAQLADHRRQLAAFPGSGGGGFEGSALHRGGPTAHLTATSFVLDETGHRTVLVLHRKLGCWLQPGGHLEAGDASLAAAALREAAEETGLGSVLRPALGGAPLDLQRHALATTFGRCTEHLDVAFLFVAPSGAVPAVSDESERVAWFDVDALPADVVADLPPRLARAQALLQTSGGRITE